MKVRFKARDETGVTGEVLSFVVLDGTVFFDVVWYGRPGVHRIPASQVEVPCSSSLRELS